MNAVTSELLERIRRVRDQLQRLRAALAAQHSPGSSS